MIALLTQLREDTNFQVVMRELLTSRPIVPSFKPGKTMDETHNLIEMMKHKSAERDGFDLLFQALTGKKPD